MTVLALQLYSNNLYHVFPYNPMNENARCIYVISKPDEMKVSAMKHVLN